METIYTLNIIIPVYKIEGLKETLKSIKQFNNCVITINDDGQFNNYSDILKKEKRNYRFIQMCNNVGQGMNRQYGLDSSNEEIVGFIDCGDKFYNNLIIPEMLSFFKNNKNAVKTMFRCLSIDFNSDTYASNIKEFLPVNGQFFRREFLVNNSINFYHEGSWMMEDFGINLLIADFFHNISKENLASFNPEKASIIKIEKSNSASHDGDEALFFDSMGKGLWTCFNYYKNKINKLIIDNEEKFELIYKVFYRCLFLNINALEACFDERIKRYLELMLIEQKKWLVSPDEAYPFFKAGFKEFHIMENNEDEIRKEFERIINVYKLEFRL